MRFSPKSLLLCSVMFSVGCATTPSWMAGSKAKAQQSEKAKLLAAAEQYERDGKSEMAEQIYARIAAQDAKKNLAGPELEVAKTSPETHVETSSKPTEGITAEELLAQFEKSRANRSVAQAAQSRSKPMPSSDETADASPFRNVSSETLAEIPKVALNEQFDDVPDWARGLDTAPSKVKNEIAVQEPKAADSKSDLPLWTLEKIDPSAESDQSTSEQLSATEPNENSQVQGDAIAMKSQSIDEWWDTVFVSEESVQTSEPEIVASDNPFAESKVVEEQVEKPELSSTESSDTDEFQNPLRIEDVPEFEDAVGGWRRTSLARLCPELKPELEPLVRRLDSMNEDDKMAALIEIAEMGEEAESAKLAVRALHQADNELVQIYAAAATRSIESDAWDSVKVLKNRLVSDDPEVVQLAAYTLGKIGPEAMEATDALCELRDAEVSATSLYAAEALTRITPHDGRSFEQFTKALHSNDSELRWFAAVTLGNATKLNQERAVVALAEALRDSEPNVRTAAALSLGGFGEGAQPVLNDLKHAAEFDTPEVREAARTALACLK